MNRFEFEKFTKKTLCVCALSTVLVACGGGGGGGGSSSDSSNSSASNGADTSTTSSVVDTTSPVDYSPSADRKLADADSSSELYVEQDFNFSFSETVSVSVSALSMEGDALSDAVLSIYCIPDDVDEWTDELLNDASLIAKGRTDSNGDFNRDVEMFGQSDKLLLVLDAVGIENKHVVDVTNNSVESTFQ